MSIFSLLPTKESSFPSTMIKRLFTLNAQDFSAIFFQFNVKRQLQWSRAATKGVMT